MNLHVSGGMRTGGVAGLGGRYAHPVLGEVRYNVRGLSDVPDVQVGQTVGLMCERVNQDSRDPGFMARALSITGCGTPMSQVENAYNHVKGAITFTRDEVLGDGVGGYSADEVVETIIRPVDMARFVDAGMALGDCDDFSMYLAAILEAVGVRCKFCTVAADSRAPGQFSHIYVVAYPEQGVRVALDASHGDYPGWEAPNEFGRREEWGIEGAGGVGVMGVVVGVVAALGVWRLWSMNAREAWA